MFRVEVFGGWQVPGLTGWTRGQGGGWSSLSQTSSMMLWSEGPGTLGEIVIIMEAFGFNLPKVKHP